ncbi:hypothetical protein ACH5RR_031832 [Cinchona calisaya]|uniref:Uncharacterized protein n=1 Tax=Cinchona calisaya TaxID=153742 RepID=A0ABD2YGD7_9GENT
MSSLLRILQGKTATGALAQSSATQVNQDGLFHQGMCELAEIQIEEKEEKVNLATSMNLAKVDVKELHVPDPKLEMDMMECLLNDTFWALLLMFDFSEKLRRKSVTLLLELLVEP